MANRRTVALLVLALFTSLNISCGGNNAPFMSNPTPPTQPTDPNIPDVNGAWTGTLESAEFSARQVSATLVQVGGTCLDGGWKTTTPEWTGAISGFVNATSYTGFLSLEGPQDATGLCAGVYSTNGSVGVSGIKWTFVNDGNCAGGVRQTVTFTLRR